tara:strand:+ start:1883 stop:2437 length:555 start_codon:yes stop_codon:yes gene_type:complete
MAFQTGTRVDPRLGALDFSGFTNAASIQAAALQDLGNRVGDAIGKSKEKKQKKALEEGISGLLRNQPEIAAALGVDSITAESADYDIAAKSVVDILGVKTGQALYGSVIASALEGEEDDLISIKTQQDFKDFISESDDYRIKDGQLINRRTNEVIGLGSKDPILKLEGVSDFLNLGKNPLGVED